LAYLACGRFLLDENTGGKHDRCRGPYFGRQVGAAITSVEGDILSVGCNEVPKAGGGQYWEGDPGDERDHEKGNDSNDARKNAILDEIMNTLPGKLPQREEIRTAITKTSLFAITEFGRAVHAEMEAILACGRKGISTIGRTLYTTTFPCHNCARHIIGAGIAKVVYIEPYPKSKAKELHEDAIAGFDGADSLCRERNPSDFQFEEIVQATSSRFNGITMS